MKITQKSSSSVRDCIKSPSFEILHVVLVHSVSSICIGSVLQGPSVCYWWLCSFQILFKWSGNYFHQNPIWM